MKKIGIKEYRMERNCQKDGKMRVVMRYCLKIVGGEVKGAVYCF